MVRNESQWNSFQKLKSIYIENDLDKAEPIEVLTFDVNQFLTHKKEKHGLP